MSTFMNNWLLRRAMSAPRGSKEYIQFADPAVEAICVQNFSSDGIGVTMQDAAVVTSQQFGTTFRGNTQIVSFDEFQYFTGVTSLPNNAFNGCSNLVSISLPGNLAGIGSQAFMYCSYLNTIHFGTLASNLYLGSDIFYGTANVKNVYISSLDDWFLFNSRGYQQSNSIENSNPIRDNGHLYVGGQEVTSVTIPASLQWLSARMFRGLVNLSSVTIPSSNSISLIGASCFEGCQNLSLDISGRFDNVTVIYQGAFSNAQGIVGDLHLPSLQNLPGYYVIRGTGITSISSLGSLTDIVGNSLAYNSNLSSVEIPDTVQTIQGDSFYGSSPSATFVVRATTPPTAGYTIFGAPSSQKIYVPYSADHSILDAYKAASGWSTYASRIYELNPDGTIPS